MAKKPNIQTLSGKVATQGLASSKDGYLIEAKDAAKSIAKKTVEAMENSRLVIAKPIYFKVWYLTPGETVIGKDGQPIQLAPKQNSTEIAVFLEPQKDWKEYRKEVIQGLKQAGLKSTDFVLFTVDKSEIFGDSP